MKIEVTDLDIKRGTKRHMFYCPIALAFERALLNSKILYSKLSVTFKQIIVIGGKTATYKLPEIATDFIRDFDSENAVSPITFDVIDGQE